MASNSQSTEVRFQAFFDAMFHQAMKKVYTAIPAHVIAFDAARQVAQIQIGILRVDVNGETSAPPPIIECPVLFLGDGFTVEFQVDAGCEGLAIFSQRCIDGWFQTGGVAANPLARFHDMSDCLFIPGFRPMPNVISGFSNNGIRIRNKDGKQFAWLKNDGSIAIENGAGHIRMDAGGTVTINGVTIDTKGNIKTPTTVEAVTVTASNNVIGGGISLNSHVHTNTEPGTGTSGAPQ